MERINPPIVCWQAKAHPMFVAKTLVEVAQDVLKKAVIKHYPKSEIEDRQTALSIQQERYTSECN